MNKTWKKKWIKALLSGEYTQCKGALRVDPRHPDAYCCLGVLCDIIDRKLWILKEKRGEYYTYLGESSTLPPKIRRKTDITLVNQFKFTEMNDLDKFSFTKIAAWIDKNL